MTLLSVDEEASHTASHTTCSRSGDEINNETRTKNPTVGAIAPDTSALRPCVRVSSSHMVPLHSTRPLGAAGRPAPRRNSFKLRRLCARVTHERSAAAAGGSRAAPRRHRQLSPAPSAWRSRRSSSGFLGQRRPMGSLLCSGAAKQTYVTSREPTAGPKHRHQSARDTRTERHGLTD